MATPILSHNSSYARTVNGPESSETPYNHFSPAYAGLFRGSLVNRWRQRRRLDLQVLDGLLLFLLQGLLDRQLV